MIKRTLLVASALVLAACTANGNGTKNSPSSPTNEKIIYINSQLVDCTGVAPMKCMQVREEGEAEWSYFYDGIEGFNYKAGNQYKLKIKTEDVVNPPMDASSIRYILVEQLEVNPVK